MLTTIPYADTSNIYLKGRINCKKKKTELVIIKCIPKNTGFLRSFFFFFRELATLLGGSELISANRFGVIMDILQKIGFSFLLLLLMF